MEMENDSVWLAATTLFGALPMLAVDVALLALAVSRWDRHPRTSMFAAAAGILLALLDSVGRFAFTWLPLRMQERGDVSMSTVLTVMSGASTLLHTVAMALLVAAVFSERGKS